MLSNAGLHKRFWAEAASTACYLINRSPSIALNKKTPIEVWSGSPADYSQLRVSGCTAYAHVDNGKLEPRAVKCIFLGYKSGVKGFKLWNPETQKVVISRNVIFNESAMLHDVSSTMFPLRANNSVLFSSLLFRWSMLLIQVIHLVMKLLHMMNPSLMMIMSLPLKISLLFHPIGILHVKELGGVLINLTG